MDVTQPVIILSRRDITLLMSPADHLSAVENGFRAVAAGRASSPAPMHLQTPDGGFHAKGGLIETDIGAYAVLKFNGNFPGNTAEPTIQGLILVSNARTGAPLAVLDSIEVTLRRTAAASALAAKRLARLDSNAIAFCGCGAQAWAHLAAFSEILPLVEGTAWDVSPGKAAAFAFRASEAFGLEMRVAPTLAQATLDADVIITTTTASMPFLGVQDVAPGAFVAAVGADAPHKNEISPSLMKRARVFVDVLAQCVSMGDLRAALQAGAMRAEDVCSDLTDLVAGKSAGRQRADEIIVFDSTGTAIEDAASAAMIFERATERRLGVPVTIAAS